MAVVVPIDPLLARHIRVQLTAEKTADHISYEDTDQIRCPLTAVDCPTVKFPTVKSTKWTFHALKIVRRITTKMRYSIQILPKMETNFVSQNQIF